MNAELSFIHLFSQAGTLVKLVMLILFGLSVASWTLIGQRVMCYMRIKRQLHGFRKQFGGFSDLNRLYEHLLGQRENLFGIESVLKAGFREFFRLRKQGVMDTDVLLAATERTLRVQMDREAQKLEDHLPFLATVGSVSVYIGLFGTVWGIMTAFQALGQVQQATLAMVAPGISEALVATAIGLFAAIPAVFAYHRFTNTVEGVLREYDNLTEEFQGVLSRQLVTVAQIDG